MIDFPVPLLGFCAWSGAGKTTLLRRLLPLLRAHGLRVAVVKHAHHSFDVDHPGKDSYELREAGADQVLVASRNRVAWIRELQRRHEAPPLEEVLRCLDNGAIDLVLVEGYKSAALPKIEVHRPALGRPLLHPGDPHVIAVASDRPVATPLPWLDLNRPVQVARFILRHLHRSEENRHADHDHSYRSQLCR